MKIEIPAKFEVSAAGKDGVQELENKHTGYIILPDAWTGRDLHEWPGRSEGVLWHDQWEWAKARVKEWAIKDIPTNPAEIGNDTPWPLINFITASVHFEMHQYADDNYKSWYELLNMPEPFEITAAEFLAYSEASNGTPTIGSNLIDAYKEMRVFVRTWPKHYGPKSDPLVADLGLITAVVEQGLKIIKVVADMGKSPVPPGGHYMIPKG